MESSPEEQSHGAQTTGANHSTQYGLASSKGTTCSLRAWLVRLRKAKMTESAAKAIAKTQGTKAAGPVVEALSKTKGKVAASEAIASKHRSCQHRYTHRNILKTTATGNPRGKAQEGQGHQRQTCKAVAENNQAGEAVATSTKVAA